MLKGLAILFSVCILPGFNNAGSDAESGFYLTVPCNNQYERYQVLLQPKTVCIANQPVARLAEIASVSDVYEFPGVDFVFFELRLTEKGYQLMKKISGTIAGTDCALMLDHQVGFIINLNDKEQMANSIQITGSSKNRSFYSFHQKLKEQIKAHR
jgi:hypothetical protein